MSTGAGTYPAIDPMLTPALNEVLSSLVPLRYKWSESVSYAGYAYASCRIQASVKFYSEIK